MQRLILTLLFCVLVCFHQPAKAQNFQDIRQTLTDWNNAVMNKDLEKAISVFDSNAKVILIGSGREELFKGNTDIRKFLYAFLLSHFGFHGI